MNTIYLVDTGVNNLLSVCNALEMTGADLHVCRTPDELREADRIVLPGVGAFRDCIAGLLGGGFVPVLNERVLERKVPILGICVGMQMMARRSFEGGEYEGLGWFEADVVKLTPEPINGSALRVPQIGWNNTDVVLRNDTCPPLFVGLPPSPDFYYVHSYHLHFDTARTDDDHVLADDIAATCDYGMTVTASVWRHNIVATQFHPEKSQDYGMRVLENFLRWQP
jgi:glutamine amidotransferase